MYGSAKAPATVGSMMGRSARVSEHPKLSCKSPYKPHGGGRQVMLARQYGCAYGVYDLPVAAKSKSVTLGYPDLECSSIKGVGVMSKLAITGFLEA